MSFYLLIIIQLIIMLLAAVAALATMMISHKKARKAWLERLQAMHAIVSDQQQHNDQRTDQESDLQRQIHEIHEQCQALTAQTPSIEEAEWQKLNEHFTEQKDKLLQYLNEGEEDREALQQMIESLTDDLAKAHAMIDKFRQAEANYRQQGKELQRKIRKASADLMALSSLKVSRDRLQQDNQRMQSELENPDIKNHEFMNEELEELRDSLRRTENKLQRTLAEKQFIESHFMEMFEHDPEALKQELERKQREIAMLENAVLDMSEEQAVPPGDQGTSE